MDIYDDMKIPAGKKTKTAVRIMLFVFVVGLMGNMGAIIDLMVYPEINYFDEEHLIVGGFTAILTAVLIGAMTLYAGRLEKIVKKLKLSELVSSENEKRYRELFEGSTDVIFTSTPEGFFTEINPAGVKLFGYNSREEMLHVKTEDLFSSVDDRDDCRRTLEESGFLKDHEVNMRRKDGIELFVVMNVEVVRDVRGAIISYRGTLRDNTSHKHMESQLLQSQKMESVGRLAGGVAHDFNNYLTTIQGYIDLTIKKSTADSTLLNNLLEARSACEGATDLTGQLLLFSQHQPTNMKTVNLNTLVKKLNSMIRRLAGDKVQVVENLSDNLKMVCGDTGSLSQVIVNLALNSGSFMPAGGEITITTCNGIVDPEYIKSHPEAREGDFATISFSDSGQGLDAHVLAHVFEPFFEVKDEKAEGLGLAAVYGIVMQHDGWIDVDSILGMGTTFTIFLPATLVQEGEDETDIPVIDDFSSIGKRILLVEDNDAVRDITEKMLRESGYEVIGAHDAAEAFARFAAERGDFQLVLSDVVLPGDNGLTLVDNLKSHKPDLAVLLSSGYADTLVDWNIVQARGYRFLRKPYVMPELLKAVRESLNNTS